MIDTSSVIELRHIPRNQRDVVLPALDGMVNNGLLLYPPQVLRELERHVEKSDVAYTWAKKNEAKATRHGQLLVEAKAVLARLPNLIDPEKVSAVDPADPYVIALAQCISAATGHAPTVVTNDFRNSLKKTSLSAAAGVFGFPDIPLNIFLESNGLLSTP